MLLNQDLLRERYQVTALLTSLRGNNDLTVTALYLTHGYLTIDLGYNGRVRWVTSLEELGYTRQTTGDITTLGSCTRNLNESLTSLNSLAILYNHVTTHREIISSNYLTIGKILGGAITGESKASDSYSKLIDSMERIKTEASAKNKSTALSTVCYLYYENNALRLVTSGTYGDMLLGYTGAVNVAVNIDENNVDADTLRVANPNYVFYADEQTLEAIKNDKVLSKLSALKDNKTLMVTKDEMSRQGFTALETLQKMVDFMYGGKPASGDEPKGTAPKETKPGETKPSESKQTETTAPSESETKPKATEAAEPKSVADKYKIDLDGLSLEFDDENDDVKTMQQRLYDLGYVDDKDNITGYYGEVSKKAVEEFQKANGLEVTGQADNDTLVKLFMDDAKKKS